MSQAVAVRNTVFDTRPLVIHAPQAADCPWWEILLAEVFAAERRYTKPDDLVILTWNSGAANADLAVRGHALGWFERSLEHVGLPYHVLGAGIGSAWTNRMKLDLTIEFLENTDAPFVFAADSTDVALIGDPGEILRRFLSRESGIVFNGEKNCWPADFPDLQRWEEEVGQPPFRYFNAGVWIGTREAGLAAYRTARSRAEELGSYPTSDQVCLKHAYRELYPAVVVDHRCEMFQNINRVRDEIEVRGRGLPSWSTRVWRRFRRRVGP